MIPPYEIFFHPLNGTEHGSHPSMTTRDRELVSVPEVRIEPGDLNQTPDSAVGHSTNSTTGWVVDIHFHVYEVLCKLSVSIDEKRRFFLLCVFIFEKKQFFFFFLNCYVY